LNSKGLEVPFEQLNRLPEWVNSDQILWSCVMTCVGFVCVFLLEKVSNHQNNG
jgi:hypothetical protein